MTNNQSNSASLEWLDLRRLQGYAAVSERTLRTWIHAPVDPLPAARVGTKFLVRRSEFDRWLERRRVDPLDLGAIVEDVVQAVADGR
jgi:excisionase family DNA binding protein